MATPHIHKLDQCRVCRAKILIRVLSFGPTPLANAFLTAHQVDEPEYFYPLDLYFCTTCSFLQLGHVVDPNILFGNYVYVSSTSKVFIDHFADYAKSVMIAYQLAPRDLVIDIGSNDGILLNPFKKLGMKVLGIEPAQKIARVARIAGIPTVSEFFTVRVARDIVKKHGNAAVVCANNVFAHIHDLDEVIRGLEVLLAPNGVFVMEAPYLIDFLEKKYFDLVYHEHLSYWAIKPLITLFARFHMKVIDVQKVSSHGGSIRVFVAKKTSSHKVHSRVAEFLAREKKARLNDIRTYQNFGYEIEKNKVLLLALLARLKRAGKKIIGYGAPAKGNTLLNYFSVGTETLSYIVDESSWKQSLYTPGKKIPVVAPSVLARDKVDYILVLAWNFAGSIMEKHASLRKKGTRFIIPVPRPKIV